MKKTIKEIRENKNETKVLKLWKKQHLASSKTKSAVKLYETLPLSRNSQKQELRRQRATKVDLAILPRPPQAAVVFTAERASRLRSQLKTGGLTDYIAMQGDMAKRETCLTFRSPAQLVYNEARARCLRSGNRWRSTVSRILDTKWDARYISRETQTVPPVEDSDGRVKLDVTRDDGAGLAEQKQHSQLYFYRYLTAQRYQDLAKCTYLRYPVTARQPAGKARDMNRDPLKVRYMSNLQGGIDGSTAKRSGEQKSKHSDDRSIDISKFKSGVKVGEDQGAYRHLLPPLKQSKMGSLRKQQSRNLHSMLNY